MAGCLHDTQDFKSNLNIEVAREGDILEAGQDLKDIKCKKNPGHNDFIHFKDLTLKHLPTEHNNTQMLDNIKKIGSRVVRLMVKNGKNVFGTGSVWKFFDKYFIKTNNHVVKTDDDVKHCTVEFHYDDDSRTNVLTSRGVKLFITCLYRDITYFTFHPVPKFLDQLEWTNTLPRIVIMYKNNDIEHNLSSHVSLTIFPFFCHLNLNSSRIHLMFISCPDGSFSYMKSSFFKFQPIPSNRPLFTAIKILFCYSISSIKIEIHIDEDVGNSRVIPGDVVKLGDEYIVRISKSIFQDEVKKCRLVWNGEVIGRGTRLYFQPDTASKIFSGVDLERRIAKGLKNLWIFDCHPIPKYMVDMRNLKRSIMCSIGHPHAGIKMVTFGRFLGESLVRFDKKYRRITQPGPACQCKEVGCIQYSCKTCPGSSGSPVFALYEGMKLNSDFAHFLGESVKEPFKSDGELIENINIAWRKL